MIVVHLLTENDANVVEQILEKYKAKVARSASQNLATFALSGSVQQQRHHLQ